MTLLVAAGCAGAGDGPEAARGRFERLGVTRGAGGGATIAYRLETASGESLELLFATPPPVATGTLVSVRGEPLAPEEEAALPSLGFERRLRVTSWEIAEPVTAVEARALIVDPSAPPTPRKVAVILHNFQNNKVEPLSRAEAKEQVFTDDRSTRVIFKEQSYGRAILEGKVDKDGDVFGYFTVPYDNTTCRQSDWSKAALDMARASGIDVSGYDHYIFIFPSTSSCGYAGLGQQPGSNTWINGLHPEAKRVHHELGHNFNMPHGASLACTGANGARVTLSATCTRSEYGSPFDIMGNGPRQTNTVNKARAGWIAGSNIKEVTADGVFDLLPQEMPSNGLQLLRVARSAEESFYVEYRQPFGVFDDFAPTDPVVNGILVFMGPRAVRSMSAALLDMNPQTTTMSDAPLAVGRSFMDAESRVRITLLARTAQSAQVKVEMQAPPAGDGGAPTDPPPATDAGPGPAVRDGGAPGQGPFADGGVPVGPRADAGPGGAAASDSGSRGGAGGAAGGGGAPATGGSEGGSTGSSHDDAHGGCGCHLGGSSAQSVPSGGALVVLFVCVAFARRRARGS